jgi:hypothetical protein
MIRHGDLDYALARIAARFGERPSEAAWRALAVIRRMPALIDAARAPSFRRWLAGIAPDADPHRIEGALRGNARAQVDEIGLWMPAEWQAAISWAGMLVDLPVAQFLARGGTPLTWMRDDPVYRDLCRETATRSPAGPLAPLASAWRNPDGLVRAWGLEWRRRLPARSRAGSVLLAECANLLARHGAALAAPGTRDSVSGRRTLASRLELLYRRAVSDPAAAFAFLALSALDLERLRGELLRRAIFLPTGVAA